MNEPNTGRETVSEQEPDPGAQPTPQPRASESDPEPGAANTEVFASAEFATGPQAAAAPEGFAEPESATEPVVTTESGVSTEPEPATEPALSAKQQPAARTRRRTGLVVGLGLGYAVLAAGTAFGVIAGASPAPVNVTAVDDSAYAAIARAASASAAAQSASPAAPSAAATTASPTTASPTSTLTGSVSDGVHHGDLRYFLLSPPQGPSSVQGDPDGTTETLDDVVKDFYGGTSSVAGYLQQDDFESACTLTYQDSTIGANVTIQLIRFGSASDASDWQSGFTDDGTGTKQISVPGESSAEGWSYSSNGGYSLLGVDHEGDTFFQVQVYGAQSIPASDLGRLVAAQHAKLANG
jgi:hypothetical protein